MRIVNVWKRLSPENSGARAEQETKIEFQFRQNDSRQMLKWQMARPPTRIHANRGRQGRRALVVMDGRTELTIPFKTNKMFIYFPSPILKLFCFYFLKSWKGRKGEEAVGVRNDEIPVGCWQLDSVIATKAAKRAADRIAVGIMRQRQSLNSCRHTGTIDTTAGSTGSSV